MGRLTLNVLLSFAQFAAAKAIGHDGSRSEALAALAPHLAPEQRDEVLHEALAAAKAISDDGSRSRALAALFEPHETDVMRRPPRAVDRPIVTGFGIWRPLRRRDAPAPPAAAHCAHQRKEPAMYLGATAGAPAIPVLDVVDLSQRTFRSFAQALQLALLPLRSA
jgi:hypothetical protein